MFGWAAAEWADQPSRLQPTCAAVRLTSRSLGTRRALARSSLKRCRLSRVARRGVALLLAARHGRRRRRHPSRRRPALRPKEPPCRRLPPTPPALPIRRRRCLCRRSPIHLPDASRLVHPPSLPVSPSGSVDLCLIHSSPSSLFLRFSAVSTSFQRLLRNGAHTGTVILFFVLST